MKSKSAVQSPQVARKNPSCMALLALISIVMCVLCLCSSAPAKAQFDTGTIVGSVSDPSGAALPKANVTILNTGTGVKTTQTADSAGNFVASGLGYGSYIVSADAPNFGKASSQPLVLHVGATVTVNLKLKVASAVESVEVTGTTTTIDITTTVSGSTLTAEQVTNLPINGRDVSDFLEIAPGSVGSTGYFQGSVNGLDNIFTGLNIKLDGQSASRGDVNGFLETEGQEGARVTRSSLDSIQEIDFANNGYSAESGFSLGPQMNIITKSGTNDFHGTLFEYFRNDDLDARDYFNFAGTQAKVPLKMNQFGANFAGPVIKNKLFFFANYEGDQTHLTNPATAYEVPSAYVRSQFVASMAPILPMMATLPSGCGLGSTVATCDYDTRYPDSGTYDLVFIPTQFPTTVGENTGSIRMDYHLTDRDNLMARYNINNSLTTDKYGLNEGQTSPQSLRTQLAKIEELHTFSPKLLNQFSLAVNRFYSNTASDTGGSPYIAISSFFVNLGSLPGAISFNQTNANTLPEIFDTLSMTAGKHSLKMGAQIRLNRLDTWLRPIVSYDYYSFASLETNIPFVTQKNGTPGAIGNRSSNWDGFIQDDWRLRRNFTISLGLRYDFNTTWNVAHGNQKNFDFATQSFGPIGANAYAERHTDFAPRVGFSWDPFGKGKTVVHGYGGIFYMPMQPSPNTLADNMPANASISDNIFDWLFGVVPSIQYPNIPVLVANEQNVFIYPTNPKDPYSTNWLIGIQQQIAKGTLLTVNYTGNKVQHTQAGVAFQAINLNPQSPNSNVNRPLAGISPFQNENYLPNSLFSKYNALQAQVRRIVGNLTMEANYTWSHEIDDEVNVFAGFEDPMDPTHDIGNGDWDVRHNVTASAVYNFPKLAGRNNLIRQTLGGWQSSSILQMRSGLSQNVEVTSGFFGNFMRPDTVPGVPVKLASASWPSSSYNINAFAMNPNFDGVYGDASTFGTVGRNSLRGPAFAEWDISGIKNFSFTGRFKLQFRADIFNILNHPNFSNVDTGICSSVTYPNATSAVCTPNTPDPANHVGFGTASATIAGADSNQIGTGTARQTQLSLRLTF